MQKIYVNWRIFKFFFIFILSINYHIFSVIILFLNMKHLVTGSSGYIGSEIVKKLFSMGEDVIGIDIIEDLEISKKCNFFKVDICNYDNLKSIPELKSVKCVHHNAAMVPLTRSIKNFYKSNVEGTKNILKICHMYNINHLSHMSSSAIFGSPDKNNNISYSEYNPTGEYGYTKYLAEIAVLEFMKKKIINSCSIIRPRPVIGGGRLGIFEILFDWVKEGKKIPIIGNGDNIFQFSNVEDLVDVSIETASKKINGFFNIGNKDKTTLKEDLENFFLAVESKSKVFCLNKNLAVLTLSAVDKLNLSPLSKWHYMSYSWNFHYDQEDNFNRLNWRPKKNNVDLLINSYNWYLENFDKIENNQSPHRKKINQKILKIIKKIF